MKPIFLVVLVLSAPFVSAEEAPQPARRFSINNDVPPEVFRETEISISRRPGSTDNDNDIKSNGRPSGRPPIRPTSTNGNIVAFTASRASSYTQQANSQVRFERTVTDIGYGWDGQDSVFTTYYPGTYGFSWSAVSPSNTQFRLSLMKNGREIAHAWGEQKGYQSGSNSAVLNLNKNDRVTLKVTEGRLYEPSSTNRGYTTFTGYKLN